MQANSGAGAVVERAVSLKAELVAQSARFGGLFRALALVAGAALSTACAESPMAPKLLDATVVGYVLPSIQDSRQRLSVVIENLGVRERVQYDLDELEKALNARDAQRARYHVRLAGGVLLDYHMALGSVVTDGPDVGAIVLSLHAAAVAVGGGFDISAFK